MRKSTIAIGIAAALSTQAFVTTTNADAAVKSKPQKASGPVHSQPHYLLPHHARPTGGGVLFDQGGTPVNGAPSQNFESSFDQYDAQGADDFVVTDAAGWTVSGFNFAISPSTNPPGDPTSATYDIEVFTDGTGVPSSTAVCSYPSVPGVVDPGITSLSVTLPSPCNLAQGTYWISLVVNLDFSVGGQIFWSDNSSGSGANSKWQNPGGGFGTTCATWSDLSTCGASSNPVGGGQTAFIFQILGAVGGGGGTCGAGDLCLTSTVGTDLTADACATTDTIDVTQGDQVNFCYTITNNTGVELDYHTLQNNVDGTIFSLLNHPVPAGGTFQYNNIETVGTTATYNSTWTGQDVPPGYSAEVTGGGGGDCSDRIFADGFDGSTPPCPGGGGFIDITGTGTPLNNGDDQAVAVTMPFSFNFYGTTANTLCVDNNGFVLFNTTACPTSGHYANTSLPATSLSAPAFMPMWDDFDSESGNVYTDTRGATPNRQFIVEWFNRVHFSGSSNTDGATFELILGEDGTVEFQYADVEFTGGLEAADCSGGACATIGLQNDQSLFNQFSAFEASVTDGSGVKWTATDPQVFTGTDTATVNVGAPDINVDPTSLSGGVPAGGTTTTTLDIQNLGNRDLDWTADEAPPAKFNWPVGTRYAASTLKPGETNVSAARPPASWFQAHRAQQKPGAVGHHGQAPLGVSTPSFGCNIISSSGCDYVSFNADAPGTLTSVGNVNELMFGGSFYQDDFTKEYVIGYPSGDLQTVDTATGAVTDIGPTGFADATRDIAFDAQTGTMFGGVIDGSMTDLFTVDVNTGAFTLVGPISGIGAQSYVMGLAVDPNSGQMYGIEIVTSSLVKIDKTTGDATIVGPLGYSTRFGQGLDFNAATGVLYLASIDYGAGGQQNMYKVDTTTGQATLVGPIGNNIIQLGSFGVAVPSGPCGQPADLPWLSLSPTSGTTPGGSDTPVTVTIDGTGHVDGDILAGTVCVRSNDPDEATVEVPVEYTVGGGGGGGSFPPDENFDEVTAPALPSGWSTGASGVGVPWVTVTDAADTAPNAAFGPDMADVSDETMDSPAFTAVANQTVTFKHQYDLEHGGGTTAFDGAVLEISIGGGAFQDVIAAGGSFVSGGYDSTVSTCCSNPLAGRAAWSGASAGFITSEVSLPASAAGQSTVLRFRVASDDSFGETGWWVDTIHLDVGGGGGTCSPTQLLLDTSFEASLGGTGPWDSTSSNFGTALCDSGCGNGGGTAGPHSGAIWAWLGGAGPVAENATASQAVVVPSGDSRFLNFWLWIGAIGDGDTSMVVTVDGTNVGTFAEPGAPEAGYTQRSIDVSAFADGGSHTFEFSYTSPGTASSNFSLDDVTIDCTAPGLVQPQSLGHPQPANTTRKRN